MKKLYLYRLLRPIIVFLFRLLYRPTYQNPSFIPKEGKVVLAGTHVHNFDSIFLATSTKRTIHFLGKIELFQKNALITWFFHSVGVIPVDRKRKNHEAMVLAEQVLKENEVIGIFPEGTTKKAKGELLPFKLGAVAMAKHTNSKIIPFVILGEYRCFRKGLKICFAKPLDISSMNLEEANQSLREEILLLQKTASENEK